VLVKFCYPPAGAKHLLHVLAKFLNISAEIGARQRMFSNLSLQNAAQSVETNRLLALIPQPDCEQTSHTLLYLRILSLHRLFQCSILSVLAVGCRLALDWIQCIIAELLGEEECLKV
jgi:hypothetical protein